MLATQAFLLRYRPLHEELIPELLRPLSDEQLRQRPDGTQVLSDGSWDERMNLTLREWGTSQTADQVTDLVERVHIPALHAYRNAVSERASTAGPPYARFPFFSFEALVITRRGTACGPARQTR